MNGYIAAPENASNFEGFYRGCRVRDHEYLTIVFSFWIVIYPKLPIYKDISIALGKPIVRIRRGKKDSISQQKGEDVEKTNDIDNMN
jgi:hypothetical protein